MTDAAVGRLLVTSIDQSIADVAIACYHSSHPRMSDEQFHEFHLDGKQMVFLFMASTVMAVVIFLCGVMVGRGVRENKAGEPVEKTAVVLDDAATSPLNVEGAEATAPDGPEDLTYPERLDSPTAPTERLRATESRGKVAETPVIIEEPVRATAKAVPPAAVKVDPPAAGKGQAPTAAKVEAPAPSAKYREPNGSGFAVQVMSGLQQKDAEAEAGSLMSRGYNAFLTPNDGKSSFRVRIGKYKTKKEAEAVRNRLRKIGKYQKAWIPPNH